MRYIIAAATIALVAGIALGFVLGSGAFEAEAKPPPEIQPVEEQNLDGNGFMAVHEQGVAEVNVTNASLSVAGTVDVGNQPQGRVILVGENINVPQGGLFQSDWIDTADCSRLAIFLDPPSTSSPSVRLSADGVTVNAIIGGVPVGAGSTFGGIYYLDLTDGLPIVAPQVAVAFGSLAVVDKVWLYCAP